MKQKKKNQIKVIITLFSFFAPCCYSFTIVASNCIYSKKSREYNYKWKSHVTAFFCMTDHPDILIHKILLV